MYIPSGYPTLGTSMKSDKTKTLKIKKAPTCKILQRLAKSTKSKRDAHFKKAQKKMTMIPPLTNQHLVMQMQRQNHRSTQRNSNKCLANYKQTKKTTQEYQGKSQPTSSDKHSDLYTDENPKGTIHVSQVCYCRRCKSKCSKNREVLRRNTHIKFK